MNKNKKGFTLIELIASILLLGVILTIATVSISSINTEYISCNLENSFIKVYYDEDILLTEIDIDCINSK